MNTVFFVQNLDAKELKVFGKKHQVRRYRMEHPNHQIIEKEYQWHYKSELVTIMNRLLKVGQENGDYLMLDDEARAKSYRQRGESLMNPPNQGYVVDKHLEREITKWTKKRGNLK